MEEFFKEYLKRGFGSMNKSEIEVWIFNYLLKVEPEKEKASIKGLSDYRIAVKLKIPESKVKQLRYNASLMCNSKSDDDIKKELGALLSKLQYKEESSKIQFLVTDKLLRQYIADKLAQDNRFFDTSFNSSIVSMHISDFCYLLTVLFAQDKIDEIINQANKKEVDKLPTGYGDIFVDGAVNMVKNIAKEYIGDATLKVITNCIENYKSKKQSKSKKQ